MQKQLKLILTFFLFFSFGKNGLSQNCAFPESIKTLQGNNISADILIDGSLFWDRSNAGFQTNTQPTPFTGTIFNTGIWLGGFDNNGDLRLAAAKYPADSRNDFSAGPIINDNGQMVFDCDNFDRLWEVYNYEIEQHIADFADNGIINNPIQNIYAYPAQ